MELSPEIATAQRSLLLRLRHDLIDPGPQLEIGAAERLFRGQQRDGRGAARRVFLDGVGRREPEAIGAMPMQTRHVQLVVTGDMRRRLAGGEAAVDFGALEMLACLTISHDCDKKHTRIKIALISSEEIPAGVIR